MTYTSDPLPRLKPDEDRQRDIVLCPRVAEIDALIGESEAIHELKRRISRVAPTDINVLITGETGTGKELVARAIHAASPRRYKDLACINCSALPDALFESELFGHARGAFTGAYASRLGKFRHCNGGTVFLDEIGELSLHAQAKLLRVIETHEIDGLGREVSVRVDFRLVAATNRNLEERAQEGHFRSDLYFRLNVARIHIPPLRERVSDLSLLIGHYLPELNRAFSLNVQGVDEAAMNCLRAYSWPGNVRELKNVLEAAYLNVCGPLIALADLPDYCVAPVLKRQPMVVSEKERMIATLDEVQWNKSKAAEKLKWSRMTLYRKLAKYKVKSAT